MQRVTLFTGGSVWLVTGCNEARELLAHPTMAKDPPRVVPHPGVLPPELHAAMWSHLLTADPPDHTGCANW
ncbi:hypothetical protein ACFXKG_32920 [Streptomyces sp. NPDC059255]|uniref:hypothetical protein n=1 Tax=Streptomyces sp. NPDC059255 TaxID=3346793 RepID=UPI0036A763F5